jgi:hypothetical protein
LTKTDAPQGIISLKQQAREHRNNTECCKTEKKITYKGKPIKITAHFSMETLNVRRTWSEVFQALNKNNFTLGYATQQNNHSK